MFKAKDIDKALDRLFRLFDEEAFRIISDNCSEEMEDISPSVLAKHFDANADVIYGYRVMGDIGGEIDYYGRSLFNQRAVNLMVYGEDMMESAECRTLRSSELWLLEDMTFVKVNYFGMIVFKGNEPACATEYRYFDKKIETSDDIFFEPCDLVCSLDDICMFAQLSPEHDRR